MRKKNKGEESERGLEKRKEKKRKRERITRR